MVSGHLFFDRAPVSDMPILVAAFGPKAFASPFRSTVPLVALAKDAPGVLHEMLRACGIPERADLHFEFAVASEVAGSRPSQTDLMARTDSLACAVEAKWTEPRYETVSRRLERRAPDGTEQRAVVSGWLDMLQPHAARKLMIEDFSGAVYQMVHRAASACVMSNTPVLAYLHFTPSPAGAAATGQYRDDLAHLHHLLGDPAGFRFHLAEVELAPTPAFEGIAGLKKGQLATDRLVRAALLTERLFDFRNASVELVGAER